MKIKNKLCYLLIGALGSLWGEDIIENSQSNVQNVVLYASINDLDNLKTALAKVDLDKPYQEPNNSNIPKPFSTLFMYLCHYDCGNYFASDSSLFTPAVYKVLLAKKPDVNRVSTFRGYSSFHIICHYRASFSEIMEAFLMCGADSNLPDTLEATPFFNFVGEERTIDPKALFCFLAHGADLNQSNRFGQTSLHRICLTKNIDIGIIAICMMYGGDMYKKSKNIHPSPIEILKEKGSNLANMVAWIPIDLVTGYLKKYLGQLYVILPIRQFIINYLIAHTAPCIL